MTAVGWQSTGSNEPTGQLANRPTGQLDNRQTSLKTSHFDWACFQAQQAGEKALKAFLYKKGFRAIITHSVRDLLNECWKHTKSFLDFIDRGRFLDAFYIPTRYPNGLPGDNFPAEFYTEKDARECIRSAELILKEVKRYIRT